VSDNGHIVLDVWIAIEILVPPASNEESGKQKHEHGERESDTQRRNGRLLDHRSQISYLVTN
jgi:hypothetical protein